SARPRTRLTRARPSARRAERIVKAIASGGGAAELVEEELDAIVPPEALAVDHGDRDTEDPILQAELERLRHLVVVAPGGERVEERLPRKPRLCRAVREHLP